MSTSNRHFSPSTIDNTGRTNVSAALTDWLATGSDGDTFILRRADNGCGTGKYWIPQGIRIGRPMTFDLNGCWLFTGIILGSLDPNFAQSQTLYPSLGWTDWDNDATNWPNRRMVLNVPYANVTVKSTCVGARIQGAARKVLYRGGFTEVPEGCVFEATVAGQGTTNWLEGQHAIRIGRKESGVWQDVHDVTIDISNIAVEFPHGDGIYIIQGTRNVTIKGRKVGEAICGGQIIEKFGPWIGAPPLGGLGATIDTSTSPHQWLPEETAYPGVHHTARQGIAMTFSNENVVIDGISMWRVGRSAIDWEMATGHSVNGSKITNCEFGNNYLGLISNDSGGTITNWEISNNVVYAPGRIQSPTLNMSRGTNWLITNNKFNIKVGGTVNNDPIVNVVRGIDGLTITNNQGFFQFPSSNNHAIDVGSSTGVTISPSEFTQFPEGYKQIFPARISAPASMQAITVTQP